MPHHSQSPRTRASGDGEITNNAPLNNTLLTRRERREQERAAEAAKLPESFKAETFKAETPAPAIPSADTPAVSVVPAPAHQAATAVTSENHDAEAAAKASDARVALMHPIQPLSTGAAVEAIRSVSPAAVFTPVARVTPVFDVTPDSREMPAIVEEPTTRLFPVVDPSASDTVPAPTPASFHDLLVAERPRPFESVLPTTQSVPIRRESLLPQLEELPTERLQPAIVSSEPLPKTQSLPVQTDALPTRRSLREAASATGPTPATSATEATGALLPPNALFPADVTANVSSPSTRKMARSKAGKPDRRSKRRRDAPTGHQLVPRDNGEAPVTRPTTAIDALQNQFNRSAGNSTSGGSTSGGSTSDNSTSDSTDSRGDRFSSAKVAANFGAPTSAGQPDVDGGARRQLVDTNPAERKLAARAQVARVTANSTPVVRPTVVAAKPVVGLKSSKGSDRSKARGYASKGFSVLAMMFVVGMAISSSVPASALLTSADVAAQTSVMSSQAPRSVDAQTYTASGGDTLTVARDGYETSTIAQIAQESGIRMEATFTNNPNGTIQWPFPVGVHIGDRFGARDCEGCSSNHHGQDFNPGYGAPVQSIADGVVRLAFDGDGSLGVHMIIDHEINGQLVSSVYAHMEHGSMLLSEGDKVKVGQNIGLTGTTGMSTGPHLHFEIRLNGTDYVDPLEWLYANTN